MTHARLRAATIVAAAGVVLGNAVAAPVAQGPPAGVRRIDLQRHDLGAPGREVVQVRVEFDAGVAFGRHSHPGEEIVNVLEGSLRVRLSEGERELNAGEMIFTGPGDAHDIRATADATVLITVSAQADDFRPGESRSAAS